MPTKKNLLSKEEFIAATHLDKFHLAKAAGAIMSLTDINKINEAYYHVSLLEGLPFIEELLKYLQVSYKVDPEELERIPKTGSFIAVSNHPFGMLDGIMFIDLLARQRPEFKVMANFLLTQIENIAKYFIPVNPFEDLKGVRSSLGGIKATLSLLEQGNPIGIFPAGEVSSYQAHSKSVADREWQKSIVKLIKKAQVPVVPVYFQGSNSAIFHLAGMIHPLLRTARLPSELFNKENLEVKVRIGTPISVKEQDKFTNIDQYGRYLRARTYALGSTLSVKKFFKPKLRLAKKVKPIVNPAPAHLVEMEVEALRHKGSMAHRRQDFEIFIASANEIPNILHEIGRLREQTFREVGEGTNKAIDLDEYDLYFKHIFIWDTEARKIVGSYRLGKGKDIMERYGKNGFYIQSLFKIHDEMNPILNQAIELGRSFIVSEYQKKRLSLVMLWQGILFFLLKNPEYRYLVGPVSISNQFSSVSKSLMVQFILNHHYNYELAQYIKPRKRFKPNFQNLDTEALVENQNIDLKTLDDIIEDIEPTHFSVPVLLKKYIGLNAKIIGFNIDPHFNDALDGLIILDIQKVPEKILENLKQELQID